MTRQRSTEFHKGNALIDRGRVLFDTSDCLGALPIFRNARCGNLCVGTQLIALHRRQAIELGFSGFASEGIC